MGLTAFPYTSIIKVPANTLLGNNTGTISKTKALTPAQARTLLDIYDTTYINNALSLKADLVGGLIPSSQLPSYVDDVLEYANFASFPPIGEAGKIYVAIDTSRTYRWSGSTYIEITDTTALWGSIGGTLSNQTDLTTFLSNTYTPQARTISAGTGLTGGGDLSANRTISLANTAVTPGPYGSDSQVASFTVDAQGRLTAASNVTITGRLPVGGTAGQILAKIDTTNYNTEWIDNYAKEVVQIVKNSTHTTLYKGQAVYINGADGTNPTIGLSQANAESSSSKTLGILKQDLAHGEFGYVVTEGFLDGLNTNAAGAEGDPIWLSPTVAGGLIYGSINKPYAPNHMVFLGYVIRKNTNNGRIYVKIQNGFELKELHDVVAQSPNDGDIIRYVSSSGLWSAQPMPVGYTDENAQDAVGGIVQNSSNVSLSYNDNTPSLIADLVDTSVVAGGYGSTSQVATFTVDAKGRLTAAGNATITPSSIGALGSLNGLTGSTQTFATGTSGTDFNIVSSGTAHTFNLPDASTTARGSVTTGTQSFAGVKSFTAEEIRLSSDGGTALRMRRNGNFLQIENSVSGHNSWVVIQSDGSDCARFRNWIWSVTLDTPRAIQIGTINGTGVVLDSPANNILEQINGTNSQISRLYNTHTNTSNYERLALQFGTYSSARYAQLATESAGTGTANINLVLTPRGTGAFILGPPPDGTAVGGNARGDNAVDLQTLRASANQVASGQASFITGYANRATAPRSFASGTSSLASADNAHALGVGCSATAEGSFSASRYNTASGIGSTAVCNSNLASASASFASGDSTQATAFASQSGGHRSIASRYCQRAHAAGWFTANGDCQSSEMILRGITTTNAAVRLRPDGSSQRLTIASGQICQYLLIITGVRQGGSQVATYMRKVCIKNIGGTTSLVGNVETIGTDLAVGTSLSITADDINDDLAIEVTGILSQNWRWNCIVYGGEIRHE